MLGRFDTKVMTGKVTLRSSCLISYYVLGRLGGCRFVTKCGDEINIAGKIIKNFKMNGSRCKLGRRLETPFRGKFVVRNENTPFFSRDIPRDVDSVYFPDYFPAQ